MSLSLYQGSVGGNRAADMATATMDGYVVVTLVSNLFVFPLSLSSLTHYSLQCSFCVLTHSLSCSIMRAHICSCTWTHTRTRLHIPIVFTFLLLTAVAMVDFSSPKIPPLAFTVRTAPSLTMSVFMMLSVYAKIAQRLSS